MSSDLTKNHQKGDLSKLKYYKRLIFLDQNMNNISPFTTKKGNESLFPKNHVF